MTAPDILGPENVALPATDPASAVPTGSTVARAARPALLTVDDLHVHFVQSSGVTRAVEGVSFSVRRGEILALVGESGCGKSATALALMRLLAKPAGRVVKGRVMFDGVDLLALSEAGMRERRGRDISMIFQEPMTSLNPVLSIGEQLMEPLLAHLGLNRQTARARAMELLTMVGMTDPARRLEQYPHHLSGGMRQRVMIAMGLACNPKLIIADEPTTALDVTIQAQILELMRDLARRLDIAMIVITHNLGIVARYADAVNVMYAARLVELGGAEAIFGRSSHPYTVGLIESIPRLDRPRQARLATIEGMPPDLMALPSGCRFAPRCPRRIEKCQEDPPLEAVEAGHLAACWRAAELFAGAGSAGPAAATATSPQPFADAAVRVSVRDLKRHFTVSAGRRWFGGSATVKAVDGVSFDIRQGETLGLVGESGCGKSTIGRAILNLDAVTAGSILVDGQDIADKRARDVRRRTQIIFQDPFSSLNPRMNVREIIGEALAVYRLEPDARHIEARVQELLGQVGLMSYMADRYPHELSGGQRQRVGIARALALKPSIIVCDEPVSALDVSIQGQIINLLDELQQTLGLTYLFIAHDLAVVRHISHRVAVMYLGRIMELADRDELYRNPRHPYTQLLLDAAPVPDPVIERRRRPQVAKGELPSPINQPRGCVFSTRCPMASAECSAEVPPLREIAGGHHVACIKVQPC
jgi:peptide/nickel transport system ATP-binding protein